MKSDISVTKKKDNISNSISNSKTTMYGQLHNTSNISMTVLNWIIDSLFLCLKGLYLGVWCHDQSKIFNPTKPCDFVGGLWDWNYCQICRFLLENQLSLELPSSERFISSTVSNHAAFTVLQKREVKLFPSWFLFFFFLLFDNSKFTSDTVFIFKFENSGNS